MFTPIALHFTNLMSHVDSTLSFAKDQDQTKIIVGINNDDSSQKGNGSGKSAIIEAISLAIAGTTVRKATAKELIREGADSATIILKLLNTIDSSTLIIERTVYSSTAAQQVSLKIIDPNGEEIPIKRSDVNEYNREIWKQLDISKEDFFSFFLLTKENYKAFLTVGDADKKAIINRFSGAYKVDATEDIILEDCKVEEEKLQETKTKLANNQGKQELIKQQIKEQENQKTPEAIAARTAVANQRMTVLLDNLELLVNEKEIAKGQLTELDNEFARTNYDTKIAEIEGEVQAEVLVVQEVEQKIQEAEDELKQLRAIEKSVIDKQDNEINEFKAYNNNVRNQIHQYENDLKKVEVQIAGAIECPKCHTQFVLGEESLESLTSRQQTFTAGLKSLNKTLSDRLQKLENIKVQHIAQLCSYKESIDHTLKSLDELETLKSEQKIIVEGKEQQLLSVKKQKGLVELKILSAKKKIAEKANEVQNKLAEVERLEQEIEHIEKGEDIDQMIAKLKKQYSDLLDEEDQLIEEESELSDKVNAKKEWLIHFKNFKSYIANKAIKHIADFTNENLKAIGSNLSIAMDGYRVLKSSNKVKEQITTNVLRDGFDLGSYGKFSAGERSRIDISVILAIQQLININSTSGGLDLLIADEVLDSVDSHGLECIVQALRGINRTILIVSQNEINALREQTIYVTKTNKKSIIS